MKKQKRSCFTLSRFIKIPETSTLCIQKKKKYFYFQILHECNKQGERWLFRFFCESYMSKKTHRMENTLIWVCSKCRLALTRLLQQSEGSVQPLNYQNCQSKRVAAGSIHGCERTSTSSLPEWLIHADGIAKIITTRLLMCDSIPHSRFTKVIGGIRRGRCHFLLPEVQAKG